MRMQIDVLTYLSETVLCPQLEEYLSSPRSTSSADNSGRGVLQLRFEDIPVSPRRDWIYLNKEEQA